MAFGNVHPQSSLPFGSPAANTSTSAWVFGHTNNQSTRSTSNAQNGSLFAQAATNGASGFGTTSTHITNGRGTFGSFGQQSTGGLFGWRPAGSSNSGGVFGSTQSSGGLFGNTQSNNSAPSGGIFGQSNSRSTGGGGFGNNTSASSGGVFGNQHNTNTARGEAFGASNRASCGGVYDSTRPGLFGTPQPVDNTARRQPTTPFGQPNTGLSSESTNQSAPSASTAPGDPKTTCHLPETRSTPFTGLKWPRLDKEGCGRWGCSKIHLCDICRPLPCVCHQSFRPLVDREPSGLTCSYQSIDTHAPNLSPEEARLRHYSRGFEPKQCTCSISDGCQHRDAVIAAKDREIEALKGQILFLKLATSEKVQQTSSAEAAEQVTEKPAVRDVLAKSRDSTVCGFCLGAGTPFETTFNRADEFKRHLQTVHGAYQPKRNGKCSICECTFTVDDFYDHLDNCFPTTTPHELFRADTQRVDTQSMMPARVAAPKGFAFNRGPPCPSTEDRLAVVEKSLRKHLKQQDGINDKLKDLTDKLLQLSLPAAVKETATKTTEIPKQADIAADPDKSTPKSVRFVETDSSTSTPVVILTPTSSTDSDSPPAAALEQTATPVEKKDRHVASGTASYDDDGTDDPSQLVQVVYEYVLEKFISGSDSHITDIAADLDMDTLSAYTAVLELQRKDMVLEVTQDTFQIVAGEDEDENDEEVDEDEDDMVEYVCSPAGPC